MFLQNTQKLIENLLNFSWRKNLQLLDTWFTLHVYVDFKQIPHCLLILPLSLQKICRNFVIYSMNVHSFNEWLMKFSVSFLTRLTQQQNDKFKRLSSRYPRHVLASIQKAWCYSTFDIHESIQNRRYRWHQGKYSWKFQLHHFKNGQFFVKFIEWKCVKRNIRTVNIFGQLTIAIKILSMFESLSNE